MFKKSILIAMTLSFFLTIPSAVNAQSDETLELKVANYYWYKLCSTQPFKGIKIHWKGVRDERPDKLLGLVTKKHGKDPVKVRSVPPLQDVFAQYLQLIWERCGMQLQDKVEPGVYELSAVIKSFTAYEEKRLITGKGKARSMLEFVAKDGSKTVTARVGYVIEFKKGRKRGIRRLKSILTELFKDTLKQVVSSPELQGLRS